MTVAPMAPRRFATTSPSPLVEPVTSAVLPFMSMASWAATHWLKQPSISGNTADRGPAQRIHEAPFGPCGIL